MNNEELSPWMRGMVKKHGSVGAVREFMRENGRKGGKKGTTGGFYANRELASKAGRLGALKSKMNRQKNETK